MLVYPDQQCLLIDSMTRDNLDTNIITHDKNLIIMISL